MRHPHVGGAVETRTMWEPLGVWVGLDRLAVSVGASPHLGWPSPRPHRNTAGLVGDTEYKGGVVEPFGRGQGPGGSPCEPGPGAWDLVKSNGDAASLCSLILQGVQSVVGAQVGQELLAVDWSAWVPSCVVMDAGLIPRAGGRHVRSGVWSLSTTGLWLRVAKKFFPTTHGGVCSPSSSMLRARLWRSGCEGWSLERMLTTPWRARTSSSRCP